MSLINDALKRTKEAQQHNQPTAGGPPLKTVDPATAKSAKNTKSLLYIIVACVIFGNALLFLAIKDRGGKKSEPTPVSQSVAKAEPAPSVVSAPPAPAPAPQPAAAVAPAPAKVESAPVSIAAATPAAAVAPAETNLLAVPAQPEPPKPVSLKLQSIIYSPSRPSAMISGKFVFIGDKVQGSRVIAIGQETVTLVSNNQTNVLSLP